MWCQSPSVTEPKRDCRSLQGNNPSLRLVFLFVGRMLRIRDSRLQSKRAGSHLHRRATPAREAAARCKNLREIFSRIPSFPHLGFRTPHPSRTAPPSPQGEGLKNRGVLEHRDPRRGGYHPPAATFAIFWFSGGWYPPLRMGALLSPLAYHPPALSFAFLVFGRSSEAARLE